MTYLCVYHHGNHLQPVRLLNHQADIAGELEQIGVVFEQLPLSLVVDATTSEQQILTAYQTQIEKLKPADTAPVELQRAHVSGAQPLVQEFSLNVDEVRFFVAGRALLCLHVQDHVYAMHCHKGDVLRIPAGLPRWFDAGEHPHFVALRIGATAADEKPTGAKIAAQYQLFLD